MPLLGNRPHLLNSTVRKSKRVGEEAPTYQYIVPETKEICSSEDELKRKTKIYESKIWTCRVTGKANLTYKEALKSERDTLHILKQSVSDYHRGMILQIVHASSSSLEPLTTECWMRVHERFAVGEPVLLKIDSNKPISATVVSVDPTKLVEQIDLTKDETSSPNNSDKENNNNNANSKRLPMLKDIFSYSVQIESDEPVKVNNVPSKCMQRINRAPSKDHIRMFIRAHAMRYGPASSGPWIVDTGSLRKYCPNLKLFNNMVDKDKLRILSEAYEIKFYEKIVSQGGDINGETAIKLSPKSLKLFKNLSVLRDDSILSVDSPAQKKTPERIYQKETAESKSSKKMKQAMLPFDKSEDSPTSRKNKSGTPMKSEPPLPFIAKRLIRHLKGKADANLQKKLVNRCAEVLTDPQIRALPENVRKLVIEKKIALEHRRKMQNMTLEQQKAYLKELRKQSRTLIDENAPSFEVDVKPLPQPRAFPLPSNMTSLQFSRVLSFTEFIACYQPLLTENVLSPGEALYPSQIKKLAADMCPNAGGVNGEEAEEEFDTDVEEESALTSADAGLPKASIQGLRCLNLDRTLQAVNEPHMTASAYRCLTRPMSAILRFLFQSEQYSKKSELGIELSKIPVTPYTAPELLRLLLSCELAKGTFSTNDLAINRIRHIINSSGGGSTSLLEPFRDALGASNLFEQLSSVDLFALNVEHRILAIEILVELMLDFDMVDEYIISCHQRSIKANRERVTLAKQERTVIPPELMEEKTPVQKEPEMNDLASVVKSRRLLAAKAAEEREKRETVERQRRELEAKIEAEEKALAKAEHDETVATTDYQLSCRARLLGTDRFDRRYWRFTCAPNRIFVESNWAPEDCRVFDSLTTENYRVASLPPPQIVANEPLSSTEPAHRFGNAAHSNWFVFDKAEELDNLSSSLAERGARESHLKKSLVQSGLLENLKELIAISKAERSNVEMMEPVDVDRSSSSRDEIVIEKITAKTRGDAQAILANVFLKNMYETEIHLRDGGLGGVPEFPGWMAKILSIQSHYGLCFCLTGSVPSTPLKGGPSAIHTPSPATLQCRMSSQPQKITTTPLQSSAEALITMGLNVHKRFLSVPKVLPREKKAGSESIHNWEEGGPEEVGQNQPNVEYRPERSTREGDVELWLESWTKAVRSASTLSRLHVLHACLDACIQWEKSVANVRCRICRKKGDDDSLLLCDGCNAGFHLYCLRPSLHTIPEGDWFCVSCKPPPSRTKPTTSATSIRWRDRYARDEGSETSSGNEESVGGGDCESESASSDGDDGGRRRLRSKKAQSTRRTVSRSSSHSSIQTKTIVAKTQSLSNDVICLVCDEEGIEEDELIVCSTCPNAFHSNCHNPPLRSASRRAPWVCSVCRVGRGQSMAMGQSLRPRGNSRVNRKSSYARLHKVSTAPRKRPRPVSYNEDSSEDESLSSEGTLKVENEDCEEESGASGYEVEEQEESEETGGNDTEATEEQADDEPPPSKRARVSASAITTAKSASYSCADLISSVLKHRNSWPFQEPVDAEEVPDYYEIVVDPVDLSMINKWLKSGRYDGNEGPRRLAKDLAKMFYNAELYNSVDSDIWRAGSQLENHIRTLFKKFSPPVKYKRDALN
nr:zinc finger protein [Hymenolepis microstoma]